jgi:hypothetical protein
LIENIIREAKGKEQVEEYVTSLRKKTPWRSAKNTFRLYGSFLPRPIRLKIKKAIQSGQPVWWISGLIPACLAGDSPHPEGSPARVYRQSPLLVIDVYKFKELAGEYRVQLIPTLIFFDKNGKKFSAIWVPGINLLSLAAEGGRSGECKADR